MARSTSREPQGYSMQLGETAVHSDDDEHRFKMNQKFFNDDLFLYFVYW